MSDAELTRDHDRIKSWAEARGGRPSVVTDTMNDKRPSAILRFDFGKKDASLSEVDWSKFFELFDDNRLALLLQEKTKTGRPSRFHKFVDAEEKGVSVEETNDASQRKSSANGAAKADKASGRGKTSAPEAAGSKRDAAKAASEAKAASKPTGSAKASTAKASSATGSTTTKSKPAPKRASKADAPAATTAKNAKMDPAETGSTTSKSKPAPKEASKADAPAATTAKNSKKDPAEAGAGSDAVATTDHDAIRAWVEARGGWPTIVSQTRGKKAGGVLRIDFQEPDDGLKKVSWDEFFAVFDKSGVAFLHQDKTKTGRVSRFYKFVDAASVPTPSEPAASAQSAPANTKTSSAKRETRPKAASSAAQAKSASPAKGTSAKAAPAKAAPAKAASAKASSRSEPSQSTETSAPASATPRQNRASRPKAAANKAEGSSAAKAPRRASGTKQGAASADAAAGKARTKATPAADDAKTTTDHALIREWVEARGGRPSHVADTARKKGELGILRIDFGSKDENLEGVTWPKFLKAFDRSKLAFLYKEKTASGNMSRFCKFVDRDGA